MNYKNFDFYLYQCTDGKYYQPRQWGYEIKYIVTNNETNETFPIKFNLKKIPKKDELISKLHNRLDKMISKKQWESKKDTKILNDKVWLDKIQEEINNELIWIVKKVKTENEITSGQITSDFVKEFPASIFNKETLFKFLKQLTNQPTWNDIRIYILNHNFEGVN